jgi:murein DD-endopeptidase MepM/ murein hydrolase activator NlpD
MRRWLAAPPAAVAMATCLLVTTAAAAPTTTPRPIVAPAPSVTVAALATPSTSPGPTPTSTPTSSPTPSASPTSTPTGTPRPSPTPPAASTPTPGPTARQKLIDDIRTRLGASLASAFSTQVALSTTLDQNAGAQQQVLAQLQASSALTAQLDASMAARDQKIRATEQSISTDRAQIRALARAMDEQPSSLLVRLLQAGSLHDLLVSAADLTAAGDGARTLETSLDHELRSLRGAQAQQAADRRRETDLQAQQARSLERLRALQLGEQQDGAALGASMLKVQAEISGAGSQDPELAVRIAQELQAELAQLIAAAEQDAWTQATLWLEANPGQVRDTAPVSTGHLFIWPLAGFVITQPFGPTDLAIEPPFGGYPHFHTGIDLAGPLGTPIWAAADGVVAAVGSGTTGYGNYVVITHAGGISTLYGHLDRTLVTVGAHVTQGQPIGLEGSTGNSTGPHLHFEVRVNGQPVDPMPYL